MTESPEDGELRRMLRELPLPAPPPGFAEAVMTRVRSEHDRRRFRPWLLGAAAAALAASGLLFRPWMEPSTGSSIGSSRSGAEEPPGGRSMASASGPEFSDPARQEFEAILEEYRLLAEEIETMRRFSGEPPFGPLIRIGGTDQLDLFLDVQSYLNPPALSRTPAVVPASDQRR